MINIRWMIRRDMAEVIQIEQASFQFPWSADDFLHCLRQRNVVGMVAEVESRVVGFMVYELHKHRIQLLDLAVSTDFRRRGIGGAMIARLASKLSTLKRSMIMVEVRETNLAAQLFFRDQGFRAISLLREFYPDCPGEDAYLMQFKHQELSNV